MVLFYIVFLIPLITATRRSDAPSYRSNIMEGEKPILRMGPEADDEGPMGPEADDEGPVNSDHDEDIVIQKFVILETKPTTESPADPTVDNPVASKKTGLRTRTSKKKHGEEKGEGREPSRPTKSNLPVSANDMKRLVNWLIDNFSYDLIAMGRKNNNGLLEGEAVPSDASNETEKSDADEDEDIVIQKFQVTESPSTESPVDPTVDTPVDDKDNGLRSNKNKKKPKKQQEDPEWMTDLKEFIKDLTTRYGQHEVLDKTKPAIASIEKKHHIKIKDIDVDEYGEIKITYTEKRKNKKASRQSKKTDDDS